MFIKLKRKNCNLPEKKLQKRLAKEMRQAEKDEEQRQIALFRMKEAEERQGVKKKETRYLWWPEKRRDI